MKRILLSDYRQCPFNCKYCFAKWKDYQFQPLYREVAANTRILRGIDVICPACDSDLFAFEDAVEVLADLSVLRKIISLSTKARMRESTLKRISRLNKELMRYGCFIKISVPISCLYSRNSIEEGTASFQERLENLKLLKKYAIPSSVLLKPLLPFVPHDEYGRIIDETSRYAACYLLGGLYVDDGSGFYVEHIKGDYDTEVVCRKVNWIGSKPTWRYIDLPQKRNHIQRCLMNKGKLVFHGDLELIEHLKKEVF